MSEAEDDSVELSEDELQELVDEAIDIIALSLPEDADDDYWRAFRETVERRAREMLIGDETDADADEEE
jgi:hypothetical protein